MVETKQGGGTTTAGIRNVPSAVTARGAPGAPLQDVGSTNVMGTSLCLLFGLLHYSSRLPFSSDAHKSCSGPFKDKYPADVQCMATG